MKLSLMATSAIVGIVMELQQSGDKNKALASYEKIMEAGKAAGFQAIEVTAMELAVFGIDVIERIISENGFEVGSIIDLAPYTTHDKEKKIEILENAKRMIDMAVRLKTDKFMAAFVAAGDEEAYTKEAVQMNLVSTLEEVVYYAKEKNIQVVIEDTPDLSIPICSSEELRYLLNELPDLRMVYDSGNMLIAGEDPIEYYEKFSADITHVHLKDMKVAEEGDVTISGEKLTGVLHGEGIVDFQRILECMKRDGYCGYLAIEYTPGENHEHAENLKKIYQYLTSCRN